MWSDRVVKTFTRNDWLLRSNRTTVKNVSMIVTPKVTVGLQSVKLYCTFNDEYTYTSFHLQK